jgi:polyribonucleotide nucleotidyltransferase
VLSYDADSCPHPHAITAAAAALLVSDIPFPCAVAGVRVVMCNDKFIINPTVEEREVATMDMLIAGTESAVLMIEGSAKFVPEHTMLDAIAAAHQAIAEICVQLQVIS